MASLGKIPVFAGEDYAYWKLRMRAFLQSMGAEVWEITTNQAYEVLVSESPLLCSERLPFISQGRRVHGCWVPDKWAQ